jgi:acyl-coenzyme A thioesterase PaaI-like protein
MVTSFLDSTVSYFAWTNLSVTPEILYSRVIQVTIRIHYQFLILVSCLLFLVYEGRMVHKNSDHNRC